MSPSKQDGPLNRENGSKCEEVSEYPGYLLFWRKVTSLWYSVSQKVRVRIIDG